VGRTCHVRRLDKDGTRGPERIHSTRERSGQVCGATKDVVMGGPHPKAWKREREQVTGKDIQCLNNQTNRADRTGREAQYSGTGGVSATEKWRETTG